MRVSQPAPAAPEEKKPKNKRLKKIILLVILLLITTIPLVFLGITGFFKVPGLSHLFGTSKAQELGIVVSEEARSDLIEKIGFNIDLGENILPFGNRNFNGTVSAEVYPTSEEITSFIQLSFPEESPVRSLQVKLIEGGFELTALPEKPVKMPIYTSVQVDLTGPKSVNLTLTAGKIGFIPVPKGYLEKAEEWMEEKVNQRLNQIPGLNIETLEYYDGHSYFKGTLPAKITSGEGEWLSF